MKKCSPTTSCGRLVTAATSTTGSDDVVRPADGSAVITDTFGVRYRIPAIAALDPASRRLFEKNL